jgi:hypothetical protein
MSSSTLKVTPLIVEVLPNGTQIAHHSVLGIKENVLSMVAPEISKPVIDDTSVAVPINVDLTEHSNINFLLIYGTYLDNDTPAGIVSGDYAPIEVELNNSGVYIEVKGCFQLTGTITALKYKKKNSDTRKVRVTRLISATGI